jgi:hypothetical protein
MNTSKCLQHSVHIGAIYQADLFRIGGRVWMIGGADKRAAALLATAGDPSAMLADDWVAIIRQGNAIWGRYDPGVLPVSPAERERRHHAWRIDVMAYCLSEAETALAYARRPLALARVDNKQVGMMLTGMMYSGAAVQDHVRLERTSPLFGQKHRLIRFLELTEGAVGTRFLLVPWTPTAAARAALYTAHT